MMCSEHAYVRAIEQLLGIEPPERAQWIRTLFDEITRLMNHLMWLGANGLDLGAMTLFLYCFREREYLLDAYEAVSGARMHATYYRPGGVYRDLPEQMAKLEESRFRKASDVKRMNEWREGSLLDFLEQFMAYQAERIDDYETLVTDNRIWKQRNVGIGVVSPERARQLGFTGPCSGARAWPGTAQEAALRQVSRSGFRHPGGRQRRLLRPLPRARGGNAPVGAHLPAVHRWLRDNPGAVMVGNYKVAPPSRRK